VSHATRLLLPQQQRSHACRPIRTHTPTSKTHAGAHDTSQQHHIAPQRSADRSRPHTLLVAQKLATSSAVGWPIPKGSGLLPALHTPQRSSCTLAGITTGH
jgi:hypothetical protein